MSWWRDQPYPCFGRKDCRNSGCAVCDDVDALLALEPEYIVETASVEAVRAMLCLC